MIVERRQLETPGLELWAGVECTYNRVGEHYFDQMHFSGHDRRLEDLDRFAALGVRVLRYPVLWERHAPESLEQLQWNWSDTRLERLRELGIRPIATLVHHGSGPRYTSLVDPQFSEKLAFYAQCVAERYPWIRDFTPINEPLTTARFSGLYGIWYPHGTDDRTFIRCLLNECRGIILAMRAIRKIIPAARLIQTEDMGHTTSTPLLRYQADHENHRRWLSFDLLTGHVDSGHPLWRYLLTHGASKQELVWLAHNSCPPDIVGINHYVTSDRYLDETLSRYPSHYHGGNGLHNYADVETVRVAGTPWPGFAHHLRAAWDRYGLPVAATEVHIGDEREQQMRWFMDAWTAAQSLRRNGVDVRAVTAWTLLGSFDWNCLVRRCDGFYESGVFDIRGPQPRSTALCTMLRSLSSSGTFRHPILKSPGWWKRSDRACYWTAEDYPVVSHQLAAPNITVAPLLIIGKRGTLGRAMAQICDQRGICYCLAGRDDIDIADADSVSTALDRWAPWAIINAAGYVRVDEAETDVARCVRENVTGPDVLARAAQTRHIGFVTFSSDLVFDGQTDRPYVESSPVAPLNVYGRAKAAAEHQVRLLNSRALIIRTSAFFGPWDDYNFVTLALRAVANGQRFIAADDAFISPTYVPDLVNATLNLLLDQESGIWHVANAGETSWKELAVRAARAAGLNTDLIEGLPMRMISASAKRPSYSVLSSERGQLLPPLETAINKYIRETRLPLPSMRGAELRK